MPTATVDGVTVPTASPDPGDFVDTVDNPWFPLAPGTVWTSTSEGDEGPQKDVVTVTHKTKVVQGVTTVVVHDVVRDDAGKLVENTYDWYAQDRDGNVWYFGEDTTAYDSGKPDTEGSWEAGRDDARAGIAMLAHPDVDDSYAQEYLPRRRRGPRQGALPHEEGAPALPGRTPGCSRPRTPPRWSRSWSSTSTTPEASASWPRRPWRAVTSRCGWSASAGPDPDTITFRT